MSPRLSVRTRALLAVLLLIGFYTLALGIAGGLAYVPHAEHHFLHHVTGRLAFFCLVGAAVIVKARGRVSARVRERTSTALN